jgi:hypothetical protein
MISKFKLPFGFDPQLLRADLEQVADDEWVAHFNKGYFEGEWTGVALRSFDGLMSRLFSAMQTDQPFADTPLLDRCPYVRTVLATFQCTLRSVRFLRLKSGSSIREHRDYTLGYEEGLVRLHVPVITSAEVIFFLDAQRVDMKAGECWYLDLSLPHWVENRGSTDRVHLVIDCELNDWLRQFLPQLQLAGAGEEPISSPEQFQSFRQAVLSDVQLQSTLRQTADRESFVRHVVGAGRECGYYFAPVDVEEALRRAKRTWLERWTD